MNGQQKTIITATLDRAAITAAPCRECRTLLEPFADHYRIDLATSSDASEFLLLTPKPDPNQLATLRAHRDCLLATAITITTRQFFVVEHRNDIEGVWTPFDFRLLTYAAARAAWTELVEQLAADSIHHSRATWLAAGVPIAQYPPA